MVAVALPLASRHAVGARVSFFGNEHTPKVDLTERSDLIRKDELLKPRADYIDIVRDQNRLAHLPAPAAPEVAAQQTHTVSAGRLDM